MKKTMRLLSLFLSVLFVTTACDKEEEYNVFGGVYGKISSADTKAAISGAQVMLSPGNITAVTGRDGSYEFVELEPGQYRLSVTASGYIENSRQVSVISGESVICDMQLTSEKSVSDVSLSTKSLQFGTTYNERDLVINNIGNSPISWQITNITVDWLSVSPSVGSTSEGKSSTVKVMIDRSKITKDVNTSFNVEAAGGSQSVQVFVSYKNTSSGNEGDETAEPDDEEDGTREDYSSASVSSGDSRIEAEIVSCKRSGSSVTLTYTLRNVSLGAINDFRIYTTNSNSLIMGGYRTVITDDDYTNYVTSNYTFNGVSQNQNYVLTSTFPERVKCQGTVVVKNFNASADKLTVILGIWPYDLYPDSLTDPRIYFENVPIY